MSSHFAAAAKCKKIFYSFKSDVTSFGYQLAHHNVEASYSNGPRCLSVCLSHRNISEAKRDRRMVTRKLVFCHFGCFWVGTSPIQTEMGRLG